MAGMAAWNARRRELLGGLGGTVLEIGAGDGANFAHFRAGVDWLGLEPGRGHRRRLSRAAAAHGHRPEILDARAERIPLPDASVDAVVSTITLCSVSDQPAVLAQVQRVLRVGGAFVYFEHVAAPPGTSLRRLQRTWGALVRPFGARCDPGRDTAHAIDTAGFRTVDMRWYVAAGPFHAPLIGGIAHV